LRAVPFSESVHDFIQSHERIYVVEMNRDGQMHSLLRLDLPESALKLISTARLDGLPLTAEWVAEQIRIGEEN
jgi:2-oxoglutarate ferredoxin oxidoreductase subunit alpha